MYRFLIAYYYFATLEKLKHFKIKNLNKYEAYMLSKWVFPFYEDFQKLKKISLNYEHNI